jgi:hypothetical protein
MYIPQTDAGAFGTAISVNFITYGADLRIGILEDDGIIPALSIGVGYSYSEGGLGVNLDTDIDSAGSIGAGLSSSYTTQLIQASAQISKKILFLVPYIGVREVSTISSSHWSWNYSLKFESEYLTNYNTEGSGEGDVVYGADWTTTNVETLKFNTMIFAGISFELGVTQTTVNATYDLLNNVWSGGVSTRFIL